MLPACLPGRVTTIPHQPFTAMGGGKVHVFECITQESPMGDVLLLF